METVPLTRERSEGKGIPDTVSIIRTRGGRRLPWKKPFMGYSTPEKRYG